MHDSAETDPAKCAKTTRQLLKLGYQRLAQHERRYVPIAGEETHELRLERVLAQVAMPSDLLYEAFQLDRDVACRPEHESVPYEDVLDAYRALPRRATSRRLAVLGEPGAGKTFSLGRIAAELARSAQADAAQPLPVRIARRLRRPPERAPDG